MKDSRKVSLFEAYELAAQNNCTYKEASCFENYNLCDIFEDIIKNIKYYIDANPYHIQHTDTISLQRRNHLDIILDIGSNNRRHKCKTCC